MLRLKGVIPAILTPFDETYGVDERAFEELCNYLIDKGIRGLFVAGTTGEGPLLSLEERFRLFSLAVRFSKGRVPVIAHVGSVSLKETVTLIRSAIEAKVDAIAIVSPYYYRLDEKAIEEYYLGILKETDGIPVFLYNIPGLTNNPITPGLLEKLFNQGKIIGVKDSSGNITVIKSFIDISPEFQVVSGTDELFLLALTLGAVGAVSSTSNVFPEIFNNIYDAFVSKNLNLAVKNQRKLNELCKIFQYGRLISSYKYALSLRGVNISSRVRSPQRELTGEEKDIIKEGIKNFI